jgi:hypothetical protein
MHGLSFAIVLMTQIPSDPSKTGFSFICPIFDVFNNSIHNNRTTQADKNAERPKTYLLSVCNHWIAVPDAQNRKTPVQNIKRVVPLSANFKRLDTQSLHGKFGSSSVPQRTDPFGAHLPQ